MRNDDPGLTYPMNKTQLDGLISQVLRSTDPAQRAEQWRAIMTAVHEQAIYLPLTFKTNVAVVSARVENFQFGASEFDIPVRQLRLAGRNHAGMAGASQDSTGLSTGAIAGIVTACVVAAVAIVAVGCLIVREKRGNPFFGPLLANGHANSSDA